MEPIWVQGHFSFISEFKNQWKFNTNLIFGSEAYDTKVLRGGYDMIMPYSIRSFGEMGTNSSKNIIAQLRYMYKYGGDNSASGYRLEPGITIRPFTKLKFGLSALYEINNEMLQYITTLNYSSEKRYILGTIDQETVGLTFRLDLNLTPEFSIQYYGSPFVSMGSYTEFKRVTDPESENFEDRINVYNNAVLSDGIYYLDENDDNIPDYTIGDPDFNFHQLRSNFVAKWEYRLGSFIYFVWSSERTGRTGSSDISLGESYSELRDIYPNNIFLIKLNYWFTL